MARKKTSKNSEEETNMSEKLKQTIETQVFKEIEKAGTSGILMPLGEITQDSTALVKSIDALTASLSKYNPPPVCLERNELGLLEKAGVAYVYNDDGTINWRKMVNPKYLVPNKQVTEEKDITKLEDHQLLITLAGIRNLAWLRGFIGVNYRPIVATDSYVATVCQILWTGNYETGDSAIEFESLADASPETTRGFGMKYLAAMAENRAFVRCVRNFLNISVVSEEEVSTVEVPGVSNNEAPTPLSILTNLMTKKNVTFDHIKAKLVEEKFEGIDKISKLEELPQVKIFEFIERVKKYTVSG